MSVLEILLHPGMTPFTISFAIVVSLVVVELIMLSVGGSLLGDADADLAEIDLAEMDLADADLAAAELDAPELDGPEFDAPDAGEVEVEGAADAPSGLAGWLGFGQVPFILWLAGGLLAFGLTGYVVQGASEAITGALMPGLLAAAIALIPGLRLGAYLARGLAKLLPKTETTAISTRSLGNRRGVVVQGTARRGHPAQARIRDGHGNWHYVRVEPVDDGVEISQGTEILTRGRGPILGAIPITD